MVQPQWDALRQRLLDNARPVPLAPESLDIAQPSGALSRAAPGARAKAVLPKRRRQTTKDESNSGTIFAAVLGDSIDTDKLERSWHTRREGGVIQNPKLDSLLKIVLCVVTMEKQVSYVTLFDDLECFIFSFGSIVCWGLSEAQIQQLVSLLSVLVDEPLAEVMKDEMVYTTVAMKEEQSLAKTLAEAATPPSPTPQPESQRPRIKADNIQLETSHVFEKLAYSYAIGQSVKLDAFEEEVAATINDTQDIPVHLASAGSVGMSNKAVTIKMGELFVQRCNVNLHSDILGTPDVFWDFDEFEGMYQAGRQYLDVDKRLAVLNQRLDIMKEMYQILQNQLNVKHANKLEMIVIVLIVAEIFLQTVALVVSYFSGIAPPQR